MPQRQGDPVLVVRMLGASRVERLDDSRRAEPVGIQSGRIVRWSVLWPRRRAVIPGQAEDAMGRRWGTPLIVIGFLAGLVLYGFFCYSVLTAGGLSATSMRPTCTKAAIGSETRDYRADESVPIRRSYMPPTAICPWSDGTTAALVPANVLSWARTGAHRGVGPQGAFAECGRCSPERSRRKTSP